MAKQIPEGETMRGRLKFSVVVFLAVVASASPQNCQTADRRALTKDQVVSLVHNQLGDDTGAKIVEQRGIDFEPAEEFLDNLREAGASEVFIESLRKSAPTKTADEAARKPLSQIQILVLLGGGVSSRRVATLVKQHGIDFEPTPEVSEALNTVGAEKVLLEQLGAAKRLMSPNDKSSTVAPLVTAIQQHLVKGGGLTRQKAYSEAEQEYRKALELEPTNADLHLALGCNLGLQQKYSLAIAEDREALRLNPNYAAGHNNLGVHFSGIGSFTAAVGEYREAIRLEPDLAIARRNLGFALLYSKEPDAAIKEFREALRLEPDDAEAHDGLGVVLSDRGDKESAIREYREAIRLKPELPIAHKDLGVALAATAVQSRRQSDLPDAVREFRTAIQLQPDMAEAHAGLGGILMVWLDLGGAEAELREAVRLKPDQAFTHEGLAYVLDLKGDRKGAVGEMLIALRLAPDEERIRAAYQRLSAKPSSTGSSTEGARLSNTLTSVKPLSQLTEATPTDISGEWRSLTSGNAFKVRLEEVHAYVERLVSDEQRAAGLFQMCDLKMGDGQYSGVCTVHLPVQWTNAYGQKHKVCTFQTQMLLTKYTPTRVEGRSEAITRTGKWSFKDYKECGERLKPEWKDFVWIRPD